MATATRDSSGGRLVALTLLALVALAGAGYVGLAWYIADKVPHATFVQGVDIGGLSRSAAEQRLRESLAQHAGRPVVLTWRHRDFRITPASAGLSIDYAATVDAAGSGFSLEPGRIWRYFSGGGEVRAVAGVAEPAMRSTLARLARTVQQRPVEGTIRFEAGKARPVWARAGRRLDLGAARELLVHGFLTGGRERLPVVPDEPYVSAAAVATAMHRFAQPAMSAPVVLVVGGESIIATPAEYSAALAMVPQGHELRPVVDGQRLLRAIRPAMTTVGDKPRNARFRLVRGRPTVVPARIGATFDVEDLAARFPRYLVRPVGRRRMQVKAVVQKPRFTTAEATALRVDHVVSRATAPLYDRPGAAGAARTTAGEVSGRLVHPHRLLVLSAPGSTTDPAVSQVASTLYTAAFDAGLEVVERTSLPHYRSDFALGVDARVDAGHQLRLRNDTRYGLVPVISVRPARPGHPGSVTVRLWSSRAWDVTTRTGRRTRITPARVVYDDTARCRPTTGTEGFTVTVVRVLRRHGQDSVAAQQPFTSHYRAGRAVVCGKAQGRPAHSAAR